MHPLQNELVYKGTLSLSIQMRIGGTFYDNYDVAVLFICHDAFSIVDSESYVLRKSFTLH